MKWLSRLSLNSPQPRSLVIDELAEVVRSGPLRKIDLNRFGISELRWEYLGKTFAVTWYDEGSMRSISLGGDHMFSTADDARYLLRLAVERADGIFKERVRALEIERAAQHPLRKRSVSEQPNVNRNEQDGAASLGND